MTNSYFQKPLRRGQAVIVQRRGKAVEVVVVCKWANGEGHGYACKLPHQPDHECFDVPASRVLRLA
jgi:hypothetical protein